MNATLHDAVVASRVATWYSVQVPCVRLHTSLSDRLYGTITERLALAGRFQELSAAMAVAASYSTACGIARVMHHGDLLAYYIGGKLQ